MQKNFKIMICVILSVFAAVFMTACGNGITQEQFNDLQTQIAQQQEQLQQLEEYLKQQQDKNAELESEYSALVDAVEKLQATITTLENLVPYEITAVAKSHSNVWEKPATSYLIYTQAQLQKLLDELDVEFENIYNTDGWSFVTDDGAVITKETFSDLYFNNKALVVTVFLSPCTSATVTESYVWKDENTLHVKMEYTCGNATAVETVMVIMEVDKSSVEDVDNVILELNK